jgi:hypothetical protein
LVGVVMEAARYRAEVNAMTTSFTFLAWENSPRDLQGQIFVWTILGSIFSNRLVTVLEHN